MSRLKLLFFSLFIVFFISCQEKEIEGLVANYSFDGNALDVSGNENHGVVHGANLTRDRFDNENSAYSFDGSSAFILATVSNMPAVDAPQTISCWFKIDHQPEYLDSLGADNILALVDTSDGIGVQFGYRAPGYNTLGLDAWYWGGRSVLESKQPIINQWHHCIYTFDGQKHNFYIDGIQTAQSSVQPQKGTPNLLMLGNYPGGVQYFAGSLDDVCIYNRALTLSEISLLNENGE